MLSFTLLLGLLSAATAKLTIPAEEQEALNILAAKGFIDAATCQDKAIGCQYFWRWGSAHVTTIKTNRAWNGDLADLPLNSFTKLRVLRLDPSQLSGGLPDYFGAFDDLRVVDLSGSKKSPGNLSGEIPASLFNPSLRHLSLAWNSLTGGVPSSLGDSYYLKRLILSNNAFTGGLPAEIVNLHNLKKLDLKNSGLKAGACPASELEYCDLRGTSCTGACFATTSCLQDATVAAACSEPESDATRNSQPDTCSNGKQDPSEEGIDCCFSFGGPEDANSCPCYNHLCVAGGGSAEEEIPCEEDCSSIRVRDCEIGPGECVQGQCVVGYKPRGVECSDFPGATLTRGVCNGEGDCVNPCDLNPCGSDQCTEFTCEPIFELYGGVRAQCTRVATEGASCYLPSDIQGTPSGSCGSYAGCCAGNNETCDDTESVSESLINGCMTAPQFATLCLSTETERHKCVKGDPDCFCIFDASGEACFTTTCHNIDIRSGECKSNFFNDPAHECYLREDGTACGQREPLSAEVKSTLAAPGEACPFYDLSPTDPTTPGYTSQHLLNYVHPTKSLAKTFFKYAWGMKLNTTKMTLNTGNLFCQTCNCLSTGVCGDEDLCSEMLNEAQTVVSNQMDPRTTYSETEPRVSACYALAFPYNKAVATPNDYNGARETLLESHECLYRAAVNDLAFFDYPNDYCVDGTSVSTNLRTLWSLQDCVATKYFVPHAVFTADGAFGPSRPRLTSGSFCTDRLSSGWDWIVGKVGPICGDTSSLMPFTDPGTCTAARTCQGGQCRVSYYSEDASGCDASSGPQQCTLGQCERKPVSGPDSCAAMEQSCTELSPEYCGQSCSVCSCIEVKGADGNNAQLYCKLDASACECQDKEDQVDFPPEQWAKTMSKDDYFKVRLSYRGCEGDQYSAGHILDSLYQFSSAEPDQLAVTCTRCVANKAGKERTEVYVYVKSSANALSKEDILAAWSSTQAQQSILGLDILTFGSSQSIPKSGAVNESLYLGLFIAFTAFLAVVLVIAYRRKDKVNSRQFEQLEPVEMTTSA